MQRKTSLTFLVCVIGIICASCSVARSGPRRSLSQSELLALVAGGIISENVAFDIQSRGISFLPDASYKSLLKSAGADDKVFAALDSSKTKSTGNAEKASDPELLQRLSHAGSLIKSHQLDEAAAELTNSLSSGNKSEIGFVMGMVLIAQQRMPEAGQIYSTILSDDPDFPELHSRLSLTYYETGDSDEALRQAKAALAENPNNPVAHLNAGAALQMLQHFDAAKTEYQKSIQSKPDYVLAYVDLGGLLDNLKDFDGAIAMDKKALALDPADIRARYDLGIAYADKGDLVSAIREYREVKLRDPHNLEARQNLGATLMQTDPGAAIQEFQELAALAPKWPLCHQCLGSAYLRTGRFDESEKEYRLAIEQNPGETGPLDGLGSTLETEKKYDEALALYQRAEKLDSSDAVAFRDAGRVFVLKKEFASAIPELRQAEQLDPASWINHDLHGQALEGSGDRKAAIVEYKEAVTLAPKELQARLDLALALEKTGDWVAALDNFRQAAIDEAPPKANGIAELRYDAQNQYKSAQQRFQQHLSDLRASGKSGEADALAALLKKSEAAPNLDQKFHTDMESSKQASMEKRFNDAETSAKDAIAIAEKIQPQDGRLPEALGQLGNVYMWRLDYKDATDAYKRQLALTQQLYGAESPMQAMALQNLAMVALVQKDFDSAEKEFSRAVELNLKAYGDNSNEVATSLSGLARVYFMKKDFAKTEATQLRALKIFETMYSESDYRLAIPLTGLCHAYDESGNSEKSAPCHARLVSLEEKQFGPASPYLLRDLTAEAQALRKLGRTDEAAKLEQRTQSLQSAQANPN
jgi:tetratricopeptide (TPR) repeat protein